MAVDMFLLTADPTGSHAYWIGLTDLFHERRFSWISSGQNATYANWHPGQPDNFESIEHFVVMYPPSGGERTWNDYYNDKPGIFALCQYSV
jgi:hypothetical protein